MIGPAAIRWDKGQSDIQNRYTPQKYGGNSSGNNGGRVLARRTKGASFKAGVCMIQSAFLPVPVLVPVPAPVLELAPEPGPELPAPGLGAVLALLAPLELGHSPALS